MTLLHKHRVIQYAAALLGLWLVFALFLTLPADVPKTACEENMTAAAEYFKDRANLYELVAGKKNTVIQDYSSALWLNVAWNLDSNAPFSSAMSANYYQQEYTAQTDSFSRAVTENLEPNTAYGRYWHGTAAVLKLLLCVTTVRGIYPNRHCRKQQTRECGIFRQPRFFLTTGRTNQA